MDYSSVIDGDDEMLQKIEMLSDKVIDGHAPCMNHSQLQAYRLAGVQTDHECSSYEEALEKLHAGFFIQIREGSAAKNCEAIITGALRDHICFDRFVFCTDDKHLDEINAQGHISWNIKKAISLGLNPITAIKIATINAANLYGLTDLGAVSAGYRADLVILNDLNTISINAVYKDGKQVSKEFLQISKTNNVAYSDLKHTVNITSINLQQLSLKPNNPFPVITMIPYQIATKMEIVNLPTQNGEFYPHEDLLKIAVVQRHDGSGKIGVGVVKGFGLKNGAIASTFSHDSHNLVVIADNDEDMLCAINELTRCQGGYTITSKGKVIKTLQLPVAGLFTDDPSVDVAGTINEMIKICRNMGVSPEYDPFLNLSFMALTAIPEIRITDYGIYDSIKNCLI